MFGSTGEWLERAAAPHHLVSEPNPSLAPPPPPPPQALQMSLRRSLSPYRAGLVESVTCATQVHTQDDEV